MEILPNPSPNIERSSKGKLDDVIFKHLGKGATAYLEGRGDFISR